MKISIIYYNIFAEIWNSPFLAECLRFFAEILRMEKYNIKPRKDLEYKLEKLLEYFL